MSEWSDIEVSNWIKTLDLDQKSKDVLMKRCKKHKINGNKLENFINDKTLKENLKINGIGLRLEFMEAINKQKSLQSYPSPLYENNRYQLPQHYPFDYQYRINECNYCNRRHQYRVINKQNLKSRANRLRRRGGGYKCIDDDDLQNDDNIDRKSWTLGTVVLIYCQITVHGVLVK